VLFFLFFGDSTCPCDYKGQQLHLLPFIVVFLFLAFEIEKFEILELERMRNFFIFSPYDLE
jgi:hypothetical protein